MIRERRKLLLRRSAAEVIFRLMRVERDRRLIEELAIATWARVPQLRRNHEA